MTINAFNSITLRKDGTIVLNSRSFAPSDPNYSNLSQLYMACKGKSDLDRQSALDDMIAMNLIDATLFDGITINIADDGSISVETIPAEQKVENAIAQMLDFFKDFEFTPSYRFINTLSNLLATANVKTAKDYIRNYFALMDSPYMNDIKAKMTSAEFSSILSDFALLAPTHTVNNRLQIFYGSQGTGKTTLATEMANGKCIVCNSSMLPSDLMEDFTFDSGNPTFKKTSLRECMENGTPIVFDEINLLPYDTLRFLQGILDGKAQFEFKGATVKIADGFQILGTMNLVVNGSTYGLPEPLVDRCSNIQSFELTAHQLMGAIM